MELENKIEQSHEFRTKLINMCWEDENFKSRLVNNPNEVLAELGAVIKTDRKIIVNDQTDFDVLNINIPPKPQLDNFELSDEELELVAGGSWSIDIDFSSWFICIDVTVNEKDGGGDQ